MNIDDFKNIVCSAWNSHAPVKKKVVRGNNAPFMNRTLSKAFMHRSKLKNRYLKFPTEVNKNTYKKYRNFCVSLLKTEKRKYYNNLDLKVIKDSKMFWQSVKPLFSGKSKLKTNITLVDNGKMVIKKEVVAEILKNYFIEAVGKPEIEKITCQNVQETQSENINHVIENILKRYKTHSSILKIKENIKVKKNFKFADATEDGSKINSLGSKKACMEKDIPTKILIGTNDIVSGHLSKTYNDSKNSDKYLASLKAADVTPIHKGKEKQLKENYRPISILPIISKLRRQYE